MESTAVQQTLPPQAVVMQMAMGAWVTKVIAEATRLSVPDLVKQHGSLRAAEMVVTHGTGTSPPSLRQLGCFHGGCGGKVWSYRAFRGTDHGLAGLGKEAGGSCRRALV